MQVQESEHGFVHILHINNNKLTTISHNEQDMAELPQAAVHRRHHAQDCWGGNQEGARRVDGQQNRRLQEVRW